MLLCYQVATPDVAISPAVTAYQGKFRDCCSDLAALGYDGVELMTLDPDMLDWDEIKDTAAQFDLKIPLVCTGEIFGQLGLSFADPSRDIRERAVERVCRNIDFAAYLGANVNIGRVRGQYRHDVPRRQTELWAADALKRICEHGAPKNVSVALETVTIMQTNFINTLQEAVELIKLADAPNLKLMMDIFHLNLEEKNIFEAIRSYSEYNIHVHLADNNRRYPGHCGLDFEKIISTFHDAGYDGAFCTEIFQIPDQAAAAKGAMEHLDPLFKKIYNRGR